MKEAIAYSFEGLDGSGKSTNTLLLKEELEQLGLKVVLLTSPSKSFVGRTIRANLIRIASPRKDKLFVYDIRRSARSIPDTADVVLWDRHIESVYTSNIQSDLDSVEGLAKGIPRPDKVFLLDITPDLSWQRVGAISDHPLDLDWLQLKHLRYSELTKMQPVRFVILDASRPLGEVFNNLCGIILNDLRAKVVLHE